MTRVSLTSRERELVRLLIDGCSNNEMARRLGTQPQTVKNQLTVLFAKVGVRTRLQLAVWGVRSGLDRPPAAIDGAVEPDTSALQNRRA